MNDWQKITRKTISSIPSSIKDGVDGSLDMHTPSTEIGLAQKLELELRPGKKITVSLPADITLGEVKIVKTFLDSLVINNPQNQAPYRA